MSSAGAAPRAAVPVSSARAEASRQNGAKSRGPKTPDGRTRPAQNALKHGMRAQKYVVLPDEDAAGFEGLEAALVEELAPVGALQTLLARRIAVAAWRLARADRIEAELFEERRVASGGLGLALIRDGNGARSFETLLRYRGAAMAEFWRALRTLKALQAEQAVMELQEAVPATALGARPPLARRQLPNEPERAAEPRLEYVPGEPPAPSAPARARGPVAAERTRERDRAAPCSPEPAAALDGTSDRAQRAANVRSAHFSPIMMRRRRRCHGPGSTQRRQRVASGEAMDVQIGRPR